MKDIFYSAILNLKYKVNETGAEFEDGINYTNSEMNKMNNLNDIGLKNIHKLKKEFKGLIQ